MMHHIYDIDIEDIVLTLSCLVSVGACIWLLMRGFRRIRPSLANRLFFKADLAPGRCGHCLVFGHDIFQYFLEYVGERL